MGAALQYSLIISIELSFVCELETNVMQFYCILLTV